MAVQVMNVAWLGGSFTFAILLGVVTGEGCQICICLAFLWLAACTMGHLDVSTKRDISGCARLKPVHVIMKLAKRICMKVQEWIRLDQLSET